MKTWKLSYRVLSLFLCLSMLIGMMPMVAMGAAPITDTQVNANPESGVNLRKTSAYDPETGKVSITLESYTTGTVTQTNTTVPTDIVLLLDTSGSMAQDMEGASNRMAALKTAVSAFIDATKLQNDSVENAADKHAIAVVGFASSATTVANFTTVDGTGAAALKSAVNNLSANGSTGMDYGLTRVSELLNARKAQSAYADRNRAIIVFADGEPNHYSGYDPSVAYAAINAAFSIKAAGTTIFSIGVFDGANPSDVSSNFNKFMNYLSSNYPKAYGSTYTYYNEYDFLKWNPLTGYQINAGDGPYGSNYYLAASDSDSLTGVFESISQNIGAPTVHLGASATLVDVVSDYFVIEKIGTNPTISVQVADYLGGNTWGAAKAAPAGVQAVLTGDNDTVNISGFDYDANYISETVRDGYRGCKLIVTITASPDYAAIDAASAGGTLTNPNIPTNDTMALLDSDSKSVAYTPTPKLQANTVTYILTDSNGTHTESFYRFPGADVTHKDDPTDTDEHTYSEWDTEHSEVTLPDGGETFEMPAGDVVITANGTPKEYTVTYTYTGNVPAGANPATAPAAQTYKVGDSVALQSVAAPAGYVFSGWMEAGNDITISDGSFTMPAMNLDFEGHFIAQGSSYKVEHYLMDTKGVYPAVASHTNSYDNVKTGDKVTASTPEHTGFTFDASAPNVLEGIVDADGNLTLKVYYARNQYELKYEYDGTVPGAASPTAAQLAAVDGGYYGKYYYEEVVPVKAPASAADYRFSGWTIFTGDTSIQDGTFVMPDHAVTLHGSFAAGEDTPYIVEHYFENLENDEFTLDSSKTQNLSGTTGAPVTAMPLSGEDVLGFTFDEGKSAPTRNGNISSSLVLKLYYTRTRHQVIYEYTGTVPGSANPADAAVLNQTQVKFGAPVTVASAASASGYTFSGWSTEDVSVSGGKFSMPAKDVEFNGSFSANLTSYTVEHYFMDTNGAYPATPAHKHVYDNVKTDEKVTASIPTQEGFTYDLQKTTENNPSMTNVDGVNVPSAKVLPDNDLTLKVYYSRNRYAVTYEYLDLPSGIVTDPADPSVLDGMFYYGASVPVAAAAKADGYSFSGWTIYTGDVAITDGKFTMPDQAVTLYGSFVARSDTAYTVEHYFENLNDNNYTRDSSKTQVFYGKTGTSVTAMPLADIAGFTFSESIPGTVRTGVISGDGKLVLKLCYSRTRHDVTYEYTGTVPGGVAPASQLNQTDVKYQTTVSVGAAPYAPGYTFSGWTSTDVTGNPFAMPAKDVAFIGHFVPNLTSYVVEHYLMDTEGNYPATPDHSNTYDNVRTGDTVVATIPEHAGFTHDPAATGSLLEGTIPANGILTLKVYYARNQYEVEYTYLDLPVGIVTDPADPSIFDGTFYYGESVTVAEDAEADGYDFSGWTIYTGDTAIVDGKFIMPDRDMVLHGGFVARGDTKYIVKHYFENLEDDDFTLKDSQDFTGKTGTSVTAMPLSGANIEGYTFDPSVPGTVRTGVIAGDDSLELHLYYIRTRHKVTYEYTGTVPAGADPASDLDKTGIKYGTSIAVGEEPVVAGYTFSGWSSTDVAGDPFAMPAKDVKFTGHFTPNLSTYVVEHYLMDLEGNYPATPDHSNTYDNVRTGDVVHATIPSHTGFTFDGTAANLLNGTIPATGTLVLKVYYARNQYEVKYEYVDLPGGIAPDPADTDSLGGMAYYGASVSVAEAAKAAGYTFSGWTVYTGDTSIVGNVFIMPNRDVTLRGSFVARGDTAYTVKHYFENLHDSNYTQNDKYTQVFSGKTGTSVTAMPLSDASILGYSFDPSVSGTVRTGVIAGDGSLELHLYYTRTRHKVTYDYIGTVPGDVIPAAASALNQSGIKYGTEIAVAGDASAIGYVFSGWSTENVSVNAGKFSMPAGDVNFVGSFAAFWNTYTVEHYFMDTKGAYPTVPDYKNIHNNAKTDQTVTASPLSRTGFTVDSGNSTLTGVVTADGKLTLKVYYARNKYSVTYNYEGAVVPDHAKPTQAELNARPGEYYAEYYYGEDVPVKAPAVAKGYTFSGWTVYTGNAAIENGVFSMPAQSVILHGSFVARSDTKYTVEHWFEALDSSNYIRDENRVEVRYGKTDTEVTAMPLPDIVGCSFDPSVPGTIRSGIIAEDGSLVLKLYYTRTRHNVTYAYTGSVPTGATSIDKLNENGSNIKYGAIVALEQVALVNGYTFSGWTTQDLPAVDKTFVMPARDVKFTGHYTANISQYTVEHYLMDTNGSYPAAATATEKFTADVRVGDVVTGQPKTYQTFTYDVETTKANNAEMTAGKAGVPKGVVNADGTLVLKLYYSRNAYDVTYIYENHPNGTAAPSGHNNVLHGTTVELKAADVPAGYDFDGWYNGTTLVGKYLDMPAYDVTLVGRFKAGSGIPYTVKYYLQNLNGDGYTEDTNASYKATGVAGTYVAADTKTFTGFVYNQEKSVWNGHIKGDGTLTLELYFDRVVSNVSYFYFGNAPEGVTITLNGKTIDPTQVIVTESYRYGDTVTVGSELTATDKNYQFRGWFTSNLNEIAYGTEVDAGTTFTMPAHDVAFWGMLYDYVVYYDLNGGTLNGSETVEPKHVDWDDNGLLPADAPEKNGSLFVGWYKDDTPVADATRYGELAVIPSTASITLKAKWVVEPYTVTYVYDGDVPSNAPTVPAQETHNVGDTVRVKPEPNVAGYTFSGWTTTDAVVENGQFLLQKDTVFVGTWKKKEVEVSRHTITLTKVDAENPDTMLSGARFELYRKTSSDVLVGTYTTDSNGQIQVTGLLAGNYYWQEVLPPLGYKLDATKHELSVGGDRDHEITVTNARNNAPVEFTKDHYSYVIGYPDGTVRPTGTITRAEVATIFFRLLTDESRAHYWAQENNFFDVEATDWFNNAVSTMAAAGIVNGYPDGSFRPQDPVSRAEFAAIATRFTEEGRDGVSQKYFKHYFKDVNQGDWYAAAVELAYELGWAQGYEGNYRPEDDMTRAEVMTMVNRIMEREVEVHNMLENMVIWPDNRPEDWYYEAVQEATNSHTYDRTGKKVPNLSFYYEEWKKLLENPDWAALERAWSDANSQN